MWLLLALVGVQSNIHQNKNRPNIPQGTWLWYPTNWLMAAIPDHVNFYVELWSTTISVWILTLIVLSRHPRAFNASFQIISSSTVLILRLYGFFKDLHVIWRKVTNLSWRKGEWCRAKYAHEPSTPIQYGRVLIQAVCITLKALSIENTGDGHNLNCLTVK